LALIRAGGWRSGPHRSAKRLGVGEYPAREKGGRTQGRHGIRKCGRPTVSEESREPPGSASASMPTHDPFGAADQRLGDRTPPTTRVC
jgi:hypothetical protein